MIGPVFSYQSIYVTACGKDYTNYKLGILHEKECIYCQNIIRGINRTITKIKDIKKSNNISNL